MRKETGNLIFAAYILLAVVLNIITNKVSIVVDIFAVFYGLLVVILFKQDSFKDKIYFSTLLFSILGFTFSLTISNYVIIYFHYVSVFIYLFYMLKDYRSIDFRFLLRNNYFRFLVLFILYISASIIWSMDKGLAVWSVSNYLLMIALLIVVIDYNIKSGNITKTVKYVLCIVPGIAVMGLIEITGYKFNIRNHYFDENLYRLAYDFLKRIPTTLFYNPNDYGVFIVIVMTFLFTGIIYAGKRWIKIAAGILYLMFLVNLIFTTSRTAWICLFMVHLFAAGVFLFTRKRKQLIKIVLISVTTFVIFYLLSLVPMIQPYYGKFYDMKIPEFGETGSTNERYTLIVNIVDGVIAKGNILGFGAGNTSSYLRVINNTNGITDAHSLWFEIMGDFGLPIFITFVLFYLSIIYKLVKLFKEEGLPDCYAASLLFSIFGFVFLSFAPSSVISFTPFWILMGLGISTVNRNCTDKLKNYSKTQLIEQNISTE